MHDVFSYVVFHVIAIQKVKDSRGYFRFGNFFRKGGGALHYILLDRNTYMDIPFTSTKLNKVYFFPHLSIKLCSHFERKNCGDICTV